MAIGARRASGQMRIAEALREHLPQVAALHWKGALSSRLVSTITWGTRLVQGDEAWARIDAAIAERATRWERLSEDKLRAAVEALVARYDPDAHRRTDTNLRGRDFVIGACDDDTETVSVYGRLMAPDAAVMKQRISAMVDGLCAADPRSAGERRSDAAAAIANGNDTLACRCGSPHCPAAEFTPKSNVVIRVIADQTAINEATAQQRATTEAPIPEATQRPPAPALLLGRGVLPQRAVGRGDPQRRDHHTDPRPECGTRTAVSAQRRAGRVRPDAGPVLPIPRLPGVRGPVRPRPCPAVAVGADARIESELQMPQTPPDENVLDRHRWLG